MPDTSSGLSRRQALGLLGGAGAAAAIPLLGVTPADAAPALRPLPGGSGAPPVQGLHLSFGADPATQMVASWLTEAAVAAPRVLYGTLDGGFGQSADAQTTPYVDGTSGRTVYVHHAPMSRLRPGTDYVYLVQHDGAHPDGGTFRTAPRGRAPFTFTSFGDQATPEVTWAANGTVGLDANTAPASKDTVTGIETVAPLFHLLNGDLCYANLDVDRIRTWNNSSPTTRARHGSGRGCPPRATTRTRRPTAPSVTAPTRPTSGCPPRRRTRSWPACGTRSPSARCG